MLGIRKCPKCGIDVADTSAITCPMCEAPLVTLGPRRSAWLGLLIQIVFMTTFMLLFHFPKGVILFFGAFLLAVTVLSSLLRNRQGQSSPGQSIQLSRPILYRVLSAFIALGALALLAILLFGSVIFLNAWSRYQTYEGQRFERADFIVKRSYFQRGSKGSISVYAAGTVDGLNEWMDLEPYVRPSNNEELQESVPSGTSIPIYHFPGLKGRSRNRVYSETPPAESYHRTMMAVLSKALPAWCLIAVFVFLLIGIRKSCVRTDDFRPSASNSQMQIGKLS